MLRQTVDHAARTGSLKLVHPPSTLTAPPGSNSAAIPYLGAWMAHVWPITDACIFKAGKAERVGRGRPLAHSNSNHRNSNPSALPLLHAHQHHQHQHQQLASPAQARPRERPSACMSGAPPASGVCACLHGVLPGSVHNKAAAAEAEHVHDSSRVLAEAAARVRCPLHACMAMAHPHGAAHAYVNRPNGVRLSHHTYRCGCMFVVD